LIDKDVLKFKLKNSPAKNLEISYSKVPLSNTLRLSEVKSVLQTGSVGKIHAPFGPHGDDEVVTPKVETIMIPLEFLFENHYGLQQNTRSKFGTLNN